MSDPRTTYEERRAARRGREAALAARDRQLSAARGIVFGLGLLLWWVAVGPKLVTPWSLLLPVAGFIAIVVVHERTAEALADARRAVRFYERGLARLDGTWPGSGDAGAEFLDGAHPYAADLDVLGRGSLFELVSVAQTTGGRRRLADWLRAGAAPDEVRARQAAVRELADDLDRREELAVLAEALRGRGDEARLLRWASEPSAAPPAFARPVAVLIAAANVVAIGAALALERMDVAYPSLALAILWALLWRGRVGRAVEGLEAAGPRLAVHARVLDTVDRGAYASGRLQALQQRLRASGHAPAAEVRALQRLLERYESRGNQMQALVGRPLLSGTRLGLAVAEWRARCGPHVADWLDVVAEFEALSSLAGLAYEHPEDAWPEIVEGAPAFEAQGAAHPLLPSERAVRNDVALGDVRLLLVSGSNMSGKSTLLRTVGTNLVLALAGGPVRARSLRLTPLRIGASLRVQDSLLEGRSRFFAEITRLRQIVDLAAGTPPLLFLLDEVLHGTNSADRQAGAEAIVRGLLARGALGLVTTHDLALAASVDGYGPQARNVHFEDRLDGDGLSFDYTLKPGVVTRSNALALMRAVGLDV